MRFIFLVAALCVAPISVLGAVIFFAGYLAVGFYQLKNDF